MFRNIDSPFESSTVFSCHSNNKFTIESEQDCNSVLGHSCHIQSKQQLYDIDRTIENFHISLYEIGVIHSTKVQHRPHPLPHHHRLCSSGSLLQSVPDETRQLLLHNGYPQGIISRDKGRDQPNNHVSRVPIKRYRYPDSLLRFAKQPNR